jgi:hypothetical protein
MRWRDMEDRRVGVGQARDLSTLAPPRHQLEGSSRFHLSPVHLESSLANSIHARANCKSPLDDSSRHGPGLSQTPEPAPSPHRSPDDQHAGPAARLALLNLDVSSFSRRPRSPCVQRSTVCVCRFCVVALSRPRVRELSSPFCSPSTCLCLFLPGVELCPLSN